MSPDERLFNQYTRRQIFSGRFAAGLVKQSLPYLAELKREIQLALASAAVSPDDAAALAVALVAVEAATVAQVDAMLIGLMPQLLDYADAESAFARKALEGATDARVDKAASKAVRKAVTDKPLELVSGGKTEKVTVEAMFKVFARGIVRDVDTAMRVGAANGFNGPDLLRQVGRLLETRAKAQADTLIRTVATHAASVGRAETYEANPGIVKVEQFVAVLDSGTTITCASKDGLVFPYGEGPHPALHWGCRSVRVPLMKTGMRRVMPGGKTSIGVAKPLTSRQTYGAWLKQQPASVQDEVLGAERAQIFRDGKLSITKFTDDTGKVYTLDELKALEPLAFE